METLAKDLQLAVRMLLKKPGFTVIAVLTLALGIAVNATMFSMVSAFLLRRPPGRDPQRIAALSSVNPNPGFQADAYPVSAPNYLAWREANHVFSDMAAAAEDRFVFSRKVLAHDGHKTHRRKEARRNCKISCRTSHRPLHFSVRAFERVKRYRPHHK